MIAAEQHERNTDRRREKENTIFGKCVWFEKPSAIEYANLVKRIFIVAIQWCEINI